MQNQPFGRFPLTSILFPIPHAHISEVGLNVHINSPPLQYLNLLTPYITEDVIYPLDNMSVTAIVIDHHGMQLKPLMWEVALFINLKIATFKVCISARNNTKIVWDGPDGTSFTRVLRILVPGSE